MLKRTIDIFAATLALLLLSPLMLLLAILIRLKIGSPVLFIQERPGKQGQLFKFYKFRSMTNEINERGDLNADELRMTKLGKMMRNSSLDELPSFFNVIIGNMSLVGPRPLLREYLPLYSIDQSRRHSVKPGITGWAQINGRNAISWEQKFDYDLWYVDHHSFGLDMRILISTVIKVFKREGINSETSITMEKYSGSDGR
jgi:lipopolysaccharide/colanic/teichoic acid biosynthesis glycosyltransferase